MATVTSMTKQGILNAIQVAVANAGLPQNEIEATDAVVAGRILDAESDTRAALDAVVGPVITSGTADALAWEVATSAFGTVDHAAVQASATAAISSGKRLYAAGAYTTNQTLYVNSDCDLSNLEITYTGTGTAVLVGSNTVGVAVHDLDLKLPRVINTRTQGTGEWPSGVIGIRIQNVNSSVIKVPYIANFEIGLDMYGWSYGCTYNTVLIGWLNNNKINQRLHQDADGWCNSNTTIGGRFMHVGAEGVAVSGVRQVQMTAPSGSTYGGPNNCVWINPSIEGPVPEYHLEFARASNNRFINARFEVSGDVGRVLWGPNAQRNVISGGYGADVIVQTWDATANTNSIQGAVSSSESLRYNGHVISSFSNGPMLTFLRTLGIEQGDDPTTAYIMRFNGDGMDGKAHTDAYPRIQIRPVLGRTYYGNGTAAPACYLQGATTGLLWGGGFFGAVSDNATDIGMTSAFRPRDVHVGRDVRAARVVKAGAVATASRPTAAQAGAGGMLFDTTLGKMIVSDGSAWLNMDGTAL